MRTVKECDIARWDAGAAAYARGEWFEAHEHWEAVWNGLADGALRDAVRAGVQLAAARHRMVMLASRTMSSSAALAGVARIVARARDNAQAAPLGSLAAWLRRELDTLAQADGQPTQPAEAGAPQLDELDRAALIAALGAQAPVGPVGP